MGKRQKRWAKKVRDWLFSQLGFKCVKCGATKDLEFDIIHPMQDNSHHRKMDWSWRMSFYRKQFSRGNLQVLCTKCNSKKGNQLELINYEQIDEPF